MSMRNSFIGGAAAILAIAILLGATAIQDRYGYALPRRVAVTVTTDGTGAADVTRDEQVSGVLESIRYDGQLDAGAAITVTDAVSGQTLWSQTPGGAAQVFPTVLAHDTSGTALTGRVPIVLVDANIRVQVTGGGNGLTGMVYVVIR